MLEAARVFRYYAGWADKVSGRALRLRNGDLDLHAYTLRSPVGVVALITPWNSPLLMAAWKVAPALATGCSCVLKPAELTPLTSLLMGEIAREAGVPDGVLNVVTGDGAVIGARLAEYPYVDKVAFTGSTEVGRAIIRAATGNLKKVSLELGGKSPVLVFDDANVDDAVRGAAAAILSNAGKVCTAGSRLLVQDGLYDEVVAGVAKTASEITVGHSLDPRAEMGPVISEDQRATITGYIRSGIEQGATVLAGGNTTDPGFFVEPTVLGDTTPVDASGARGDLRPGAHRDAVQHRGRGRQDRQQHPVRPVVLGVDHERENRPHRAGPHARRPGGINIHGLPDVTMQTGGLKESGWGRELGPERLDLFLETTSVYTRLD